MISINRLASCTTGAHIASQEFRGSQAQPGGLAESVHWECATRNVPTGGLPRQVA